jgi:hypothetical protein
MKILSLIPIFIFLMACEKIETPEEPTVSMHNSYYIADLSGLPKCSEKEEGQLFYIVSIKKFMVCTNEKYEVVEIAGPQGEQGVAGVNGNNGIDGAQGPQGEPGLAGINGNNGLPGTMAVADTIGELGKILSITTVHLTIYSQENYIYFLGWNGQIFDSTFYFSGADCAGTRYILVGQYDSYSMLGKMVFRDAANDKLYVPKTINADGTALSVSVNALSSYSAGICTNTNLTYYFSEMQETTKASVGIPETITAPLSIIFNSL